MGVPAKTEVHEPVKMVVSAPSSHKGPGNQKYGSRGITTTDADRAGDNDTDSEKVDKDVEPAQSDPVQFPDGGLEACLITLGAWLVVFVCWGSIPVGAGTMV
ncbi:MAG: hypothetical protein LQ344_000714 [Seirophora lacunosa]|nr:MAG: hypothetical protein LQ344_000714 [Seirophora lacunosa]